MNDETNTGDEVSDDNIQPEDDFAKSDKVSNTTQINTDGGSAIGFVQTENFTGRDSIDGKVVIVNNIVNNFYISSDMTVNLTEKNKKTLQDNGISIFTCGGTSVEKEAVLKVLMGNEVIDSFKDTDEISKSIVKSDQDSLDKDLGIRFTSIDVSVSSSYISEDAKQPIAYAKSFTSGADCLIFIANPNSFELSSDEKRILEFISKTFDKKIWKNSIILFTSSSTTSDKNSIDFMCNQKINLIRNFIAGYAGKEIAKDIPFVSIISVLEINEKFYNKSWIGELYLTIIDRIRKRAKMPFFLVTFKRIKSSEIPLNKNQKKRTLKSIRSPRWMYGFPALIILLIITGEWPDLADLGDDLLDLGGQWPDLGSNFLD